MRSTTVTTLALVALLTLSLVFSGPPGALAQQASVSAPRVWIQVNGAVEKVQDEQLTFKLDDGRRMVTDISRMSQQERAALIAGTQTTLYGYTDQQLGRFVTYFLPVESASATPTAAASAPASGASTPAVPAAATDDRPWRLVHGRVSGVDGDTLILITDAGRTITVDLRGVEPVNRAAIGRGDDVTVLGFHSGDLDQLDARFIHRDTTEADGRRAEAPAASRVR